MFAYYLWSAKDSLVHQRTVSRNHVSAKIHSVGDR
jgi:hypothetical protein